MSADNRAKGVAGRFSLIGLLIVALVASTAGTATAGLFRHRRCCAPPRCCGPAVTVPGPCAAVAPVPSPPIPPPLAIKKRFDDHRYPFTESNEPGTEEDLRKEHLKEFAKLTPSERAQFSSNNDDFNGTDRKDAKTSIADGQIENFDNLDDLLSTLKSDKKMLTHAPPITKDATSERVAEEERNVAVPAWLFATKKEADNDYHLILGGPGGPGSRQYLTAEVSGLPARNPARAALKIPRTAYQDFFSTNPIGTSYRKFDPPIPVKISGSLFFDVDHLGGTVGPAGFRPTTAWEIHPVTNIELEP